MSLRIVNLKADNYKRIRAVDITPEGNVVFIGGRNAQGKTSVLDAIWAALAGGEASKATQQPIRDGQDTAVVTLDLGEYIVTRRWTKDDSGTLTVTAADGAKYSSPQKLLDEVIGARAFDPLAFTRLSGRDQVAALTSLVELPFDPAQLERERVGIFETRTEASRAVKQIEGQLAGITKPEDDTPTTEVSLSELVEAFEAAQAQNLEFDRRVADAERTQSKREECERVIASLTQQLAGAQSDLVTLRSVEERAGLSVTQAERVDSSEISARMATVEATNATIREGQEWVRVNGRLLTKRQEVTQYTVALHAIEKRKADALAAVSFPVAGFSFDQTGVTFKGIPFSQASSAEQLRVSVGLAMAANPKLRVLRILDGSLLDADSMALIAEMASENDYQVWVEVVDQTGTVGITIEDGAVVA
ncbi:AAA family ATPase [Subtercola sp. PAMC28395]|uniref:AAA family ATPase n=1 Tax=Subtercola sp. PAMC28395 TaxID=2846775 RepID=UPI001C0C7CFD|nr:AAA family ATPase [Subtercola sp. PAMC28395]QWT24969.1 AAA family ATPase [Subtercola sp. PAMC28395]